MNWFHCRHNADVALVRVSGEILDGAEELIQQIGDAPRVELRIDSPGGNSSAALAIYEAIQGREVSVEISGKCYSAAVTLAMAGARVKMAHDARMLLHRAVQHVVGDSDVLRSEAKRLDKINARIIAIVCARTRQPEDVVRHWFASGVDTCFSADEAREAGLVDEILPPVMETPERDAEALPGEKPGKPGFTEAERLLLDFLNALGPVQTRDRARLHRELGAWFTYNTTDA